jgi:hypothetical protein
VAGVVVPVHVGDLEFALIDGGVGGGHGQCSYCCQSG